MGIWRVLLVLSLCAILIVMIVYYANSFLVQDQENDVIFPNYVKQIAEFWIEGKITDQTWGNALGFFIDNKIVVLSELPQVQYTGKEIIIPQWIYDVTNSWISDEVSDFEFSDALEYLVEERVIPVVKMDMPFKNISDFQYTQLKLNHESPIPFQPPTPLPIPPTVPPKFKLPDFDISYSTTKRTIPPGPDFDKDGMEDWKDNCLNFYNPDQKDRNFDGIGDACEPDLKISRIELTQGIQTEDNALELVSGKRTWLRAYLTNDWPPNHPDIPVEEVFVKVTNVGLPDGWENVDWAKTGYKFQRIEGYIFEEPVTCSTQYYSYTAIPLYRAWNSHIADHFYTTSQSEINNAAQNGWIKEGIAGYVFETPFSHKGVDTVPLYRSWNGQDHFYTTDIDNYYSAAEKGWEQEGIAAWVFEEPVSCSDKVAKPFYRMWNQISVDHFYTINEVELTGVLGISYIPDATIYSSTISVNENSYLVQRLDATKTINIILPNGWTKFHDMKLKIEVNPALSDGSHAVYERDYENNIFESENLRFLKTERLRINFHPIKISGMEDVCPKPTMATFTSLISSFTSKVLPVSGIDIKREKTFHVGGPPRLNLPGLELLSDLITVSDPFRGYYIDVALVCTTEPPSGYSSVGMGFQRGAWAYPDPELLAHEIAHAIGRWHPPVTPKQIPEDYDYKERNSSGGYTWFKKIPGTHLEIGCPDTKPFHKPGGLEIGHYFEDEDYPYYDESLHRSTIGEVGFDNGRVYDPKYYSSFLSYCKTINTESGDTIHHDGKWISPHTQSGIFWKFRQLLND